MLLVYISLAADTVAPAEADSYYDPVTRWTGGHCFFTFSDKISSPMISAFADSNVGQVSPITAELLTSYGSSTGTFSNLDDAEPHHVVVTHSVAHAAPTRFDAHQPSGRTGWHPQTRGYVLRCARTDAGLKGISDT